MLVLFSAIHRHIFQFDSIELRAISHCISLRQCRRAERNIHTHMCASAYMALCVGTSHCLPTYEVSGFKYNPWIIKCLYRYTIFSVQWLGDSIILHSHFFYLTPCFVWSAKPNKPWYIKRRQMLTHNFVSSKSNLIKSYLWTDFFLIQQTNAYVNANNLFRLALADWDLCFISIYTYSEM